MICHVLLTKFCWVTWSALCACSTWCHPLSSVRTATTYAASAERLSHVALHAQRSFQKSGVWLWKASPEDWSTLALTDRAAAMTCSPLNTSLNTKLFVCKGKLNVRCIYWRSVLGTALKTIWRNMQKQHIQITSWRNQASILPTYQRLWEFYLASANYLRTSYRNEMADIKVLFSWLAQVVRLLNTNVNLHYLQQMVLNR
jgi:hypothetical protein